MINTVFLDPKINGQFRNKDGANISYFMTDSKINLFVGANNSGKSRFLRSLIYNETLFNGVINFYTRIFLDNYEKISTRVSSQFELFARSISRPLLESILETESKLELEKSERFHSELRTFLKGRDTNFRKINDFAPVTPSAVREYAINELFDYILYFPVHRSLRNPIDFKESFYFNKKTEYRRLPSNDLKTAYIEFYKMVEDYGYEDIIQRRVITEYFPGAAFDNIQKTRIMNKMTPVDFTTQNINSYHLGVSPVSYAVVSGLTHYDLVRQFLLGNQEQRERIKMYENFLSNNFFEKKKVELIASEKLKGLVFRLDNEEHEVHHFGDGIQSIILITLELFLSNSRNKLVLIEEPELFMHPGLQRKFLQVLLEEELFEDYVFFFTTHSNHMLDYTDYEDEISATLFSKVDKNHFEVTRVDKLSQDLLDHLGVRSSSVFMSNCSIWVEGITDRMYFQKYLELYLKSKGDNTYSDGINYVFMEYGGSNITHFDFLNGYKDSENITERIKTGFLSRSSMVIADGDNAKGAKRDRLKILKKNLTSKAIVLEAVEVENTLSNEIIIEVLKEYDKDLDYSSLESVDLSNKKLGDTIEKKVPELKDKWAANSGTIRRKVEFAKIACSKLTNFDQLTKEGKSISRKIYNFIKTHNF